jgi:hypothetical protein
MELLLPFEWHGLVSADERIRSAFLVTPNGFGEMQSFSPDSPLCGERVLLSDAVQMN